MPTETHLTSTSWTAPAGVTSVTVECWGRGGGTIDNSMGGSGLGGGGGGAYAAAIVTVIPGNKYTITIDVASSSFASSVIALAGAAGAGAGAGAGGSAAGSTGTIKFSGGNGAAGSGTTGGGGGEAASRSANGNNASGATGGSGLSPPAGNGGDGGLSGVAGGAGQEYGGGAGGGGANAAGPIAEGIGVVILDYFAEDVVLFPKRPTSPTAGPERLRRRTQAVISDYTFAALIPFEAGVQIHPASFAPPIATNGPARLRRPMAAVASDQTFTGQAPAEPVPNDFIGEALATRPSPRSYGLLRVSMQPLYDRGQIREAEIEDVTATMGWAAPTSAPAPRPAPRLHGRNASGAQIPIDPPETVVFPQLPLQEPTRPPRGVYGGRLFASRARPLDSSVVSDYALPQVVVMAHILSHSEGARGGSIVARVHGSEPVEPGDPGEFQTTIAFQGQADGRIRRLHPGHAEGGERVVGAPPDEGEAHNWLYSQRTSLPGVIRRIPGQATMSLPRTPPDEGQLLEWGHSHQSRTILGPRRASPTTHADSPQALVDAAAGVVAASLAWLAKSSAPTRHQPPAQQGAYGEVLELSPLPYPWFESRSIRPTVYLALPPRCTSSEATQIEIGAVTTTGPYWVCAMDIYHAGAVDGEVSTE